MKTEPWEKFIYICVHLKNPKSVAYVTGLSLFFFLAQEESIPFYINSSSHFIPFLSCSNNTMATYKNNDGRKKDKNDDYVDDMLRCITHKYVMAHAATSSPSRYSMNEAICLTHSSYLSPCCPF